MKRNMSYKLVDSLLQTHSVLCVPFVFVFNKLLAALNGW